MNSRRLTRSPRRRAAGESPAGLGKGKQPAAKGRGRPTFQAGLGKFLSMVATGRHAGAVQPLVAARVKWHVAAVFVVHPHALSDHA